MTYDDYRKNKIESGLHYQDFAVDLLYSVGMPVVTYASKSYQQTMGESRTGVEIKHDEKYAHSKRLWIEVGEKARPRPGPYAPSGIRRGDNTWLYVIGDYDTVFIFAKWHLQLVEESGRYPIIENHTCTSLGFLLPDREAGLMATRILRPRAECKVVKHVHDLQELGRRIHQLLVGNGRQLSLLDANESEVDQ